MDDEYNSSYLKEPNILITTCRNPSSKLMQFQKVLFPNNLSILYFYFMKLNSQRINFLKIKF